MGIQALPNPENRCHRTTLHVVGGRDFTEQLPMELPRYLTDPVPEEQDGLGCIRGIAVAFGLQTAIVALIFAIWKLLH
jgi:hypothetical protein